MRLGWKKILGALVTVVLVGTVLFFSVRPEQIIGAVILALLLGAVWGIVAYFSRRRPKQH